jgi:hypothetical protein
VAAISLTERYGTRCSSGTKLDFPGLVKYFD